jgi:cytochrome b
VNTAGASTPAEAPQPPTSGGRPIREAVPVWDRFVRVFHWSLVSCVLLNYTVLDDGETLHQALGYVAGALVLARVAWGFIGSEHARFVSFWPTPGRLARHLQALRRHQPEHHDGHNPLGALMMLALMALVLALGVTGFAQTTDTFWGEEWLQELHETLANGLVLLAGLHAASALIMGRLERTRLVRAMITGVKERW